VPGKEAHRDGEGVLIGIIDVGGFDFAHEEFLDDDGRTRFLRIWDQRRTVRKPPSGYDYGSELTKAHMDAAIKASRQEGGLPAHFLEKQSQMSEGSHGTHVASIAAGKHGVCPKAMIAAVLIDVPVVAGEFEQRRVTFSDSSRIAHAVDYLVKLAEAEDKPISINISLGTNGGSHDGASGVSRWIDSAVTAPGYAVCVAAGNAGQEAPEDEDDLGWIFGRIHTTGRVPARGLDVDLDWVVMGDGVEDFSENEMEIWYSAQDRFIVSVQPPGEEEWFEVQPRQYVQNRPLADGTRVSIYNELYHPANGANYISIYLSPKFTRQDPRGVRAGVWKVRLHGDEVRDGRFNAWLERDDPTVVGTHGGRELMAFPSFFSAKTNVDSHSINSVACGRWVISVANLDTKRQKINVTSSQGPTRDNRNKPDIAAPGTDIAAANGFSTRSKWVSMSGTSMASPYVCGVVGLMLAANRDLTSAQCSGILQRTARPLPGRNYEWCNDAGYGQIDPVKAVEEARTFTERTEITVEEPGA
jgi:subtilisin family serine protease